MQRTARLLALAAASLAAALAPPPAHAASQISYRAINLNLEEARKLTAQGKLEPALSELQIAEGLAGNTDRQLAEIAALRASALLGLPPSPERKRQADDALAQLFHVDPEGLSLQIASAAAQARAKAVRDERPIILHERIVTARSGRPLLVRARLGGAAAASAQLSIHYRIEPAAEGESGSDDDYVRLPMELQRSGAFEAFLRPGIGGVPTGGEHVLRYWLEARSLEGAVLDQNGSQAQPVRAQLSETRTEGAGVGATVLALDEGGKAAHPVAPPPSTPWYKRWAVIGPAAGVLVVGTVLAVVLLSPKPQPASGSLGRVDLP
jgi:hypothetical protein